MCAPLPGRGTASTHSRREDAVEKESVYGGPRDVPCKIRVQTHIHRTPLIP